MEVLYPRCAGLDVHQQTVVACARVASGSTVQQDVRTFGTATADLLALADWLAAHGCTHVAMESTGVYWKPIWHVLDGQFELILANALADPQRARPQERRERCHVDCRLAGPRLDSEQLRSACGDPRAARPDAHPEAIGARSRPTHVAHPKGARGRQPEAHQRHQRRDGDERARDDRGDHSR